MLCSVLSVVMFCVLSVCYGLCCGLWFIHFINCWTLVGNTQGQGTAEVHLASCFLDIQQLQLILMVCKQERLVQLDQIQN